MTIARPNTLQHPGMHHLTTEIHALDRDVFRHMAAHVPLLALEGDVFRHMAAHVPLLATM